MADTLDRLTAALADRYAIQEELGAGGMATVYLAEDLKHHRKVAVKVLRPELAAVLGAERFVQEIETTANLQHPHILPLFDSGEADSFLYYVMPFIDGETLRDKLNRETQLGIEEAVSITTAIADALDYAHRNNVIHRDIKPENILLHDGRPMVADFGIALAVSAAAGGRMTETGLSLGTPHYMSPEQATAEKNLTNRSDIYSLGSVLYEMLTGEPPHMGNSAQQIIMKIVTDEVRPVTDLRKSAPPNVAAATAKSLEKLPADRFTSAHDFAQALADSGFRHREMTGAVDGVTPGPWKRLSIATAITTVMLAVTVVVLTLRVPERLTPEVVRFSVPLGQDAEVYLGVPFLGRPHRTSLAISPAGDLLVYSAWDGEDSRIYVRRMGQERADPIEGTEGAAFPFFSPDGAWIGFWAEGSLKRVSLADGDIETITPADLPRGATWGDDETIVYSGSGGLFRVAAAGGEAALLAAQDTSLGAFFPNNGDLIAENRRAGGLVYAQPYMLPGSETLLFHGMRSLDPQQAEIRALDLATGTQKTVLTDAMDPRYIQTGHLLFMRQGTLMAVGFDVERVEVRGQPVVMVEDVMHAVFMPNTRFETGAAQVAVSASGHLAYALGGVYPPRPATAVRVTSDGDTVPLDMDRHEYGSLRVSPDGNRLAFIARSRGRREIWVHDLTRGTTQPLNVGGFLNGPVEWSPDGRILAISSDRDGDVKNLYRLAADGSGEPERLAPSDQAQYIASWSSEGVIAFLEGEGIWILAPDGRPAPFFTSEAFEQDATFSHDGRWIAYRSNRSGRNEVYVRPYPGPEPATLISTDGGTNPAWSPDDRQIYYRQPPGVLVAVDVTPGDEFQAGRPTPLIAPWANQSPVRRYDVFPDGSFVTTVADDGGRTFVERFGATELHIVLNWFEELKARMGN